MNLTARRRLAVVAVLALFALLSSVGPAQAQGVTTGALSGVVVDAQKAPVPGATVVALHEPSGTRYEATTRADGRFSLPGMRVGGPYTVTATLSGFQPSALKDVVVNLGVEAGLELTLGTAALTEEVTVTAQTSEVFSAARTGAATTINREALQTLPTVRDRINDFARLTPAVHGRGVRRLVRRPGQPAQQHHDRRLVLQQLLRPRRPARRPHRRDARSPPPPSRRSRSTWPPTTSARATSSAPAST